MKHLTRVEHGKSHLDIDREGASRQTRKVKSRVAYVSGRGEQGADLFVDKHGSGRVFVGEAARSRSGVLVPADGRVEPMDGMQYRRGTPGTGILCFLIRKDRSATD